jgi:hypothetical protein
MGGQVLQPARQLAFDELFDSFQVEDHLAIDDSFPEQFADELSRREAFNKHLYRPNTYLHKWWARRCGSTFRTILKQLVSDPGRRDYYAPGGLQGKIVLDPMMGGATTLHEAIRLGAGVIGVDVDPIPVVQARATLTACNTATWRRSFASGWPASCRAKWIGATRKRIAPSLQRLPTGVRPAAQAGRQSDGLHLPPLGSQRLG